VWTVSGARAQKLLSTGAVGFGGSVQRQYLKDRFTDMHWSLDIASYWTGSRCTASNRRWVTSTSVVDAPSVYMCTCMWQGTVWFEHASCFWRNFMRGDGRILWRRIFARMLQDRQLEGRSSGPSPVEKAAMVSRAENHSADWAETCRSWNSNLSWPTDTQIYRQNKNLTDPK